MAQQHLHGHLATRLLVNPHIVVAGNRVLIVEPSVIDRCEAVQLPEVALVDAAAFLGPGGQPGVERILVRDNEVTGPDEGLDVVAHPGEERGLYHPVILVRDFNIREHNNVAGLDDVEVVIDFARARGNGSGEGAGMWALATSSRNRYGLRTLRCRETLRWRIISSYDEAGP